MSDGAAPREPVEEDVDQLPNDTLLQSEPDEPKLPDVPVVVRGNVPVMAAGAAGVPAYRTVTLVNPGSPQEILGRDPRRCRAVILCQLGTLLIGTRAGDLQNGAGPNAAQIPASTPITLTNTDRLVAYPNAVGSVVVTVIEERIEN